MHAILTTRHDMRLRLHRLRLAGELAEIRAADLRFSERETRGLLDASGIALSAAGAALLHQRTEGGPRACGSRCSPWPATPTRSGSSRSSLIFTACYSRHMFVWLSFTQTLTALAARCEAAWVFFGGVFKVLVPDNPSAIVVPRRCGGC